MRINWGPTILAGLSATIAVVLFLMFIPQILGMASIDITQNVGMAINQASPHIAGAIFMGVFGVFWAAVFTVVYGILPGNYLVKGTIYGVFVGLFSLAVLPTLMTAISGILGAQGYVDNTQLAVNTQALVTVVAFVVYGIILTKSYQATQIPGNS